MSKQCFYLMQRSLMSVFFDLMQRQMLQNIMPVRLSLTTSVLYSEQTLYDSNVNVNTKIIA